MRTTVERRASAGSEASSSSTARMSVVLPEPEEPTRRMLTTRRPASFLASATETSRTASTWPSTRLPSAAAILAGEGTAEGGGEAPMASIVGPRALRTDSSSRLPQDGQAVARLVAVAPVDARPEPPREAQDGGAPVRVQPARAREVRSAQEVEHEPVVGRGPRVPEASVELARGEEIEGTGEDHDLGTDAQLLRVLDEVSLDDRGALVFPAARREHEPGLRFQPHVVRRQDAAPAQKAEQVSRPAADVEHAATRERAGPDDGLEADDLVPAPDPQQGAGPLRLPPARTGVGLEVGRGALSHAGVGHYTQSDAVQSWICSSSRRTARRGSASSPMKSRGRPRAVSSASMRSCAATIASQAPTRRRASSGASRVAPTACAASPIVRSASARTVGSTGSCSRAKLSARRAPRARTRPSTAFQR